MITVWSVCVGDKYTDEDVHRLRRMVREHLAAPHIFCCLADRPIPDVCTRIPEEVWPGWWSKLLLFKYAQGINLYLDLDVVVTGDLLPLLSEELSMPANWAQSGHGGCQSSVMAWGQKYDLWKEFDPKKLDKPENGNCGAYEGLWGDQEFITREMGCPGETIVPMSGIYSYKYHCRNGLPSDARVVAFHGRPKPQEVTDDWVVRSMSTESWTIRSESEMRSSRDLNPMGLERRYQRTRAVGKAST